MPRPNRTVETLLLGGRIYPEPDHAPVDGLLIRGARIVAVGPRATVEAAAGEGARRIDLTGGAVTAGFTDAHVHLTAWALRRQQVALHDTPSPDAAAGLLSGATPDDSGWIRGYGWSRSRWPSDPDASSLDAIVGDTPVFVDSQDLHAAWLNTAALRSCGITTDTPDPDGGRIVRDTTTGGPTGLLLENARALALDRLPAPSRSTVRQALLNAQSEAHRLGITGLHSVEADGLRDFSELHEAGELQLRVLQHLQLDRLEEAVGLGLRSGFGDEWLRIGGIKMFLDGALGSRTAWLREPYEGSGGRGINTLSPERFESAVRLAARNGLASAVHAIGDAAVELALRILSDVEPPPTHPHRIEHLQLCPADLWPVAGASGVVASMQPVHLLTDIPAADRHWGHARSRGAYAFRALENAGVVLAFGSDVPVETMDPRPGLFAARARGTWEDYRRGAQPEAEWHEEHRLTGPRAVAGYTCGPARAGGVHMRSGALHPGFDADLVVWSGDPVTMHPAEYSRLVPLLTMVGGRIVHDQLTG